ncbi:MAG: hypothetical protein RBU27_04805 [Bacteroidota bacterium]|nr:hypothetical protein [Bacteroidota bacterium]
MITTQHPFLMHASRRSILQSTPTMAVILASLLIVIPLRAQDVTFSGFGATGVRMYDRNPVSRYNQEFFYEGKLQADIALSKKIEAQLDFRGDSEERTAILREVSVTFKQLTYARVRLGNVKKPYSIEGLMDRDEYIPVFDSHVHRRNAELGYAGRNVGLLVYYNANLEKRPTVPYSYAVGVFKNNSYVTTAAARGSWHHGGWTTSLGYTVMARSHDDAITTHGISIDAGYTTAAFEGTIEAMLAQDPEEGIRRRLLGQSDVVWSPGVRALAAVRVDVGGTFVRTIEPYLLLAWSAPDANAARVHRAELMAGVNVFVDDDVRLRMVADGLFTRDRFADTYSTHGSVFSIEIFFRF